jgi:hypothetical protein
VITYQCPACGWHELTEPPRTADSGGSYEICASCGFEFGVTDDDQGFTYESWRARWVAVGMPWRSDGIEAPPTNWDPAAQLQTLSDVDVES